MDLTDFYRDSSKKKRAEEAKKRWIEEDQRRQCKCQSFLSSGCFAHTHKHMHLLAANFSAVEKMQKDLERARQAEEEKKKDTASAQERLRRQREIGQQAFR